MKIHEYQARDLLRKFGVPVPAGVVIESPEDAAAAYQRVTRDAGTTLAVVKAQVHAGGRGKAGFVKLVSSARDATNACRFMLSHRMVSPQTPPEGIPVSKVLLGAGVEIAKRTGGGPAGAGQEEFYLAVTVDRRTRRNVLIASREGGVEIEQVAHDRPEAILKTPIHPLMGLQPHQARRVAFDLGLRGRQVPQAVSIMQNLARLFVAKDCSLAEINPLVVTVPPPGEAAAWPDGRLLAIDAKFSFDENGLFRQEDILALADASDETPAEASARRHGLSYVALDGSIGCLVNGAGLAMATMDIVKLHGGEPANFLDVGGSASEQAVTEAFGIILSDPRVKGVLVNIFGGIMRCDVIAQGIVNAARGYKNADGRVGFKVPLVVRLEGTNVDAGRKLLEDARKDIPTMQPATDLADAATKVCAAVGV